MALCKTLHCDLWPFPQVSRSGEEVSICGNDASVVPADWLIAKQSRATFWDKSIWEQSKRPFAWTQNCKSSHSIQRVPLQIITNPKRKTAFEFALCKNGPVWMQFVQEQGKCMIWNKSMSRLISCNPSDCLFSNWVFKVTLLVQLK